MATQKLINVIDQVEEKDRNKIFEKEHDNMLVRQTHQRTEVGDIDKEDAKLEEARHH